MPFEMRRIVFRVPEVAQAITEYHRRMHMPLPAGTILRCAAESAGPDSELRVRLVIARDDAVACTMTGRIRKLWWTVQPSPPP